MSSAGNAGSWPPGWYEDVRHPGRGRRYWDGGGWTDQFEHPESAGETKARVLFCEQCGHQVALTARFCGNCGSAQLPEDAEFVPAAAESGGDAVPANSMPERPSPDGGGNPDQGNSRVAVTAKARARLALRARTNLAPVATLELVAGAATSVKGGGMSLVTGGLIGGVYGAANIGAQVNVEARSEKSLALSITSGKRLVELCTFSASVDTDGTHTILRIGGLETYKTDQSRMYGLVPVTPKTILGFSPYKRYLDVVAEMLLSKDPTAQVSIAVPS